MQDKFITVLIAH